LPPSTQQLPPSLAQGMVDVQAGVGALRMTDMKMEDKFRQIGKT